MRAAEKRKRVAELMKSALENKEIVQHTAAASAQKRRDTFDMALSAPASPIRSSGFVSVAICGGLGC